MKQKFSKNTPKNIFQQRSQSISPFNLNTKYFTQFLGSRDAKKEKKNTQEIHNRQQKESSLLHSLKEKSNSKAFLSHKHHSSLRWLLGLGVNSRVNLSPYILYYFWRRRRIFCVHLVLRAKLIRKRGWGSRSKNLKNRYTCVA